MDGVTILATNSVYMEPSFWARFGLVIGTAGTIVFAVTAFRDRSWFDTVEVIVYSGLAIVSLLLGVFCGRAIEKQTSVFSHYEYKVLIDDSVSLNEFNEKYEILDQEGQIYTVIERKVEE